MVEDNNKCWVRKEPKGLCTHDQAATNVMRSHHQPLMSKVCVETKRLAPIKIRGHTLLSLYNPSGRASDFAFNISAGRHRTLDNLMQRQPGYDIPWIGRISR